jgi:hypothetical protein
MTLTLGVLLNPSGASDGRKAGDRESRPTVNLGALSVAGSLGGASPPGVLPV